MTAVGCTRLRDALHVVTLLAVLAAATGCSAYDESLLTSAPASHDPQDSGAGASDGGPAGATDGGRADGGHVAGTDDDGGAGNADAGPDAGMCVPNPDPDDEVCPEVCPERCNGEDDDCDLRIDEARDVACTLDHASSSCEQGSCEITSCASGFEDCDSVASNGCEVDLMSDAQHCGDCDTDCDATLSHAGTTECRAGSCQIGTCAAGYANCDDQQDNGCETSVYSTDNCGGCASSSDNEPCGGLDHVMNSSCSDGTCHIDGCQSGWADCDEITSNGCERDTTTLGACMAQVKKISIDPSFVDAPLSDFPVLVRITGDADLKLSRADGFDLFFTSDAGGSAAGATALAFELSSWSAASGDLVAWVRVPTVSDSAVTEFYLHYGDGNDHSAANTPSDVWDADFESVHHFEAGSVLDATANDTDGTNHGSTEDPAGQIGGALAFASSAYVDMGTGVLPDEQYYTVTAWVKVARDGSDGNCRTVMDASIDNSPFEGTDLGIRHSTGAICAFVGGGWHYASNDAAGDGTWSYVAARYDIRRSGGLAETSVAGEPFETLYSGDTSDAANVSSSPFQVGDWVGGGNYYFDGSIDELRVSSTARSDAWIHAEYENQRSGSSFLSVTTP